MRSAYWIKNDIRINDNTALKSFCDQSREGLIFWCVDKNYHRLSQFKQQAVMEALGNLNEKLKAYEQKVILFNKPLIEILPTLIDELKIEKLFYTLEYAYHEKLEEQKINEITKEKSVQIETFDQATLVAEKNLPFALDHMPLVFTDFRKKIESALIIEKPVPKPDRFPAQIELTQNLQSLVDSVPVGSSQDSSENHLLERMNHYFWETESVLSYKDTRNGLLDINDSTRFSRGLNLGSLSARTVYAELKKFEATVKANESTYWVVFELLWRDYFKFFSLKYGNKIFLRDGLKATGARKYKFSGQDKAKFLQWCEGKTESRFINANMNELNETGWMSNRGRQNAASYLIHDLKCPWTWGAAYFEKKLVDYDVDLNWGNWLYLSGQGSDPRSRVFNIERQAGMYDPDQLYQKKWTV